MPSDTGSGRAKVLQARAELNQFDLDAAERLAREAERLNVPFNSTEDSPKRILQDVATGLGDPKTLLSASRAALKRGSFDRAETFAKLADQKSGTFTFPLWASDSPSKALKDIDAARKQAVAANVQTKPANPMQGMAVKPDPPKPGPQPVGSSIAQVVHKSDEALPQTATPAEVAAVQEMLFNARRALRAHDLKTARQLAEQARSRAALLKIQDDSPDILLIDIARAEAGVPQVPGAVVKAPGVEAGAHDDSVTPLLTEAQRLLENGELKKARQLAEQARDRCLVLGVKGDGADQLLGEIATAEAKAAPVVKAPVITAPSVEKVVSAHALLAETAPTGEMAAQARAKVIEARTQLNGFDFDAAEKLAREAERLNVVFSPSVDSPKRVLQDVAAARNDAKALLAAARAALKRGDLDRADAYARLSDAKSGSITFSPWASDSPSKVLKDIESTRKQAALRCRQQPKPEDKPQISSRPGGGASRQIELRRLPTLCQRRRNRRTVAAVEVH